MTTNASGTLGAIDDFSSGERARRRGDVATEVTRGASRSAIGGELRESTLRIAAKLRARIANEPFVLALTSLRPDEGVSAAAAELGAVLASTHQSERVLVVDADFSSPTEHEHFGLQARPGLSDLVSGRSSISDAVQATNAENLFVLATGESHQDGLRSMNAAAYGEAIGVLRSQFHTILVKAPPLSQYGETAFIVNQSDGVVMLVARGKDDRTQVREAVSELTALGANVVGTCLMASVEPPRTPLRTWLRRWWGELQRRVGDRGRGARDREF